MAKKQITISIPTPCTEDWNVMTTNNDGKFCASCQKTVIDFSQMSDKELVDFFYHLKGKTCGRFNEKQVNRQLETPFVTKPQNRWAWALSALLLPSVAASQTVKTTDAIEVRDSSVFEARMDKNQAQSTKIDSGFIVLNGIVIDESNTILEGVLITLKNTQIQTLTDSFGRFELKIPANENTPINVEAFYVGYESQNLVLMPFDIYKEVKLILVESKFILSSPNIFVRGNFFQRTKYRLKRFFNRFFNN
jgi:hypothetical protein